MARPLKEILFREVGGKWQDVTGTGRILADVLDEYGIVLDDRCEFMRLYDYDRNVSIWYRRYGGHITLTFWPLS